MKRSTIVAGCFFLAASSLALYSSVADDEVSKLIPSDEPNARLIERIEKLEKRIEELEAMVKQAPGTVRSPTYYPVPLSPYSNGTPTPPVGSPKYGVPLPKNSSVPKPWQPFHFNGQTFYLVPCDGASRLGATESVELK